MKKKLDSSSQKIAIKVLKFTKNMKYKFRISRDLGFVSKILHFLTIMCTDISRWQLQSVITVFKRKSLYTEILVLLTLP